MNGASKRQPKLRAQSMEKHRAAALECYKGVETRIELFDADECLECTSLSPACERMYHSVCVQKVFGNSFRVNS